MHEALMGHLDINHNKYLQCFFKNLSRVYNYYSGFSNDPSYSTTTIAPRNYVVFPDLRKLSSSHPLSFSILQTLLNLFSPEISMRHCSSPSCSLIYVTVNKDAEKHRLIKNPQQSCYLNYLYILLSPILSSL